MREIQQANYWEHFKYAKDLALFLPATDRKRIEIEETMRQMLNPVLNVQGSDTIADHSSKSAGSQKPPGK